MIWAFITTSAIWLGYEIINILSPPDWDQVTVLAGAVPIGFTLVSWIFYFIRLIKVLTPPVGFFVSMFCFGISYVLHMINQKKKLYFRKYNDEFYILIPFLFILYLAVVSKSVLKDGVASSGTTYSDIPFHLSLISTFAYGANSQTSEMQTPFYAGENLCYPIIPDFFSSVLVGCGKASLRISIALPSILLLLSLTFALYHLATNYTKMRYVPEVSILFFLLASGTGWRYYFVQRCRDNINSNLVHTFCDETHTFWIHSLIHFLMPQRSAIFSMPIVVLLTSLFITIIEENPKTVHKTALLAGIMMGAIPMLSAHSYIGIGEYALFICALNFPFKQPNKWSETVRVWCIFGITAILMSLPQVLWLMREKRSDFFTLKPIHLETDSSIFGFFKVWWSSLGSFVFLALICVWVYITSPQVKMYLPSIGVWVTSNFIRYQPGAMDNTKVFYAGWYPLACVAVATFLITFWKKAPEKLSKAVIVIVVFGFSFGSINCIYQAIRYKFPMFSDEEKNVGIWMMENTARKAVVMCSGWHANTLMAIGGRIVTIGYPGWIWTHGLNYYKRLEDVQKMAANKENEELFKPLNIKYVMAKSDDKDRRFSFPKPDHVSRWVKLLDIGNMQVYRIMHDVV